MSIRNSPGSRSGPRVRRSPVMVIAGVVLVIAGALTSVGIYTNLSQTQEVIAIVAPVVRGEIIQRSHLTTVQIGFDPLLTPVSAQEINQIVGKYAVSDLVPGTFLAPNAVGDRLSPWPGMAEVGVALPAGSYPDDGLMPGDAVLLVALPEQLEAITDPLSYTGTLVTITTPNSSNMITISVLVDSGNAAMLAALAASNRLALVLSSRGE